MKTQIIALSMSLFTMTLLAQKSELKDAEKAIKKEQYAEAIKAINAAEALIGEMKEKQKAEFYFLKAQAYAGQKEYKMAAQTFNTLMDYEKQIGKDKYTDEAKPMLNNLVNEVSTKAINAYNNDKDYKTATEKFYLTYLLSPKDTSYLFNAAVSAFLNKDLDTSLKYYRELKSIGYTGISTIYMATDKATGAVENLGSKVQRDLMVRSGQFINPVDEVSASKSADIIKNIGTILSQQGKIDEALEAITEARAQKPKDLNLLLTAADLYVKLNMMDKFGQLMAEAVELDPNNHILFFNLGVVNANQSTDDLSKALELRNKNKDGKFNDSIKNLRGKAKELKEKAIQYYKRAIELKPDYVDAYTNIGLVILSEESEIVDEMNKSLSDFKKYDKLVLKQKALYKKALPYLEKSDEMKTDIQTVQTLLNLYQVLEMSDKVKAYQEKYNELKG